MNVDDRKWMVTVDYEGGTLIKSRVSAESGGKAIDKVIDDMGDDYGEILSADAEEVQ